jgi:phage gp45-like
MTSKCVAVEFSKVIVINNDSIITCTCIKLRVIGDSGDKVEATGFNKSTASDVANGITLGNVTYDVYINTSASTAELWIDQDLTVV